MSEPMRPARDRIAPTDESDPIPPDDQPIIVGSSF
jgi:hypothetical protein